MLSFERLTFAGFALWCIVAALIGAGRAVRMLLVLLVREGLYREFVEQTFVES